jgi:Zn-dependent alcohol dehydrogenase
VEAPAAPPVVRAVTVDEPQGDQVLVQIAATGICHTDLGCASGRLPSGYPVILGHEAAGVVVAVGPQVDRFAPGERVVVSVAHHCGHCEPCELGQPPLCVERERATAVSWLGDEPLPHAFGTGTFSAFVLLRQRSLAPVEDGVPLDVAAVAGCAAVTGFGAITRDADLQPGERVVVIGAGSVGTAAVLAALAAGAGVVVAVDPVEERRKRALSAGADAAVAADAEAVRAALGGPAHVVVESAGVVPAAELAVEVAGPGARVVLAGLPGPTAVLALPLQRVANLGLRLIGNNMGGLRPHVDLPRLLRLHAAGRLPLDLLVGDHYPLAEAAAAFDAPTSGAVGRVMLVDPDLLSSRRLT